MIVSHDPRIIETFCDRALLLESGRIMLGGAPHDVAARYMSLLTTTGGHAADVATSM